MKSVVLGLAFLVLATLPSAAQETRIAAVVNDEAISVADLAARMRLVVVSSNIDDSPQSQQRLGRQVLRNLIDEKLEMQEAKRLGIAVTDEEVANALKNIEQQNNMPPGALDRYLTARGVERRTLVDQITTSIAWNKVLRQNSILATPVSDEEIDSALARYKETLGEPRSRVAEIFLAIDSPQQDDEVHRFADRLYDQLRAGAKFNALAQQFSQSATAAVGGDIGWVTPSQLATDIAHSVESLKPGDFSQPIRAAGGYYIVLVIDRQAPGAANDDTQVSLDQILFPVAAGASEADRQRIVARAESVTKDAKSCGEFTQIGTREAPQTSGNLGKVRVADLPPELRQTVSGLKVAQPSQPIPLRGGIGVLMVCERESGGNGLPSREEIGDSLARERMENLARRYLRDLRRAAFVDMRV